MFSVLMARLWLGEPDLAIAHFAQAMRLNPLDPHLIAMQAGTALAHLIEGRYAEAASWTQKAMWEQSNYLTTLRIAAASYALAGRQAEAQKIIARLLKVDPTFCVGKLKEWAPFRRPQDYERLEDGLRRAGLPEYLQGKFAHVR
jgi:tetratricopeptide (TPR) repeat protein